MKTKKLTKIAGVITLLACIWGGISCEQNLPEETYTVTFDSDGGSEIEPVTVKDGEKVKKPEDPTKDGYTFKGWFNGDTEYDFETSVTANITLKAKWEAGTYTVTFDSDGGSVVESAVVKDGAKVTKPKDPTKAGYTFKGWFIGDKEYAFETAVTANITLKAKWEVVTYTVTFDSDGGSDVAAAKVNHGAKVTKPADPTKTGYTFKGWLNGETVYDFEKAVTADITLKAKWEVVTYTVKFDSDGGSVVESAVVKDGAKVTKPADPTKTGYTFKGWLNGETVYNFETAVTADITLKAKWEVVTYKITYELNNGTPDEENPTTYTIESDDFTIKNLVSGPEATPNFAGWFSDKDFTKPAVTTIKKGSTGDLSFYAKWSAKSTFTITFNFMGVEGSDSVTVEDGEALTSAQLESVKSKISSDYVFEDFYTNQECTTKFDVTTKITANSTLYVKVNEIKKFTVTFNSAGGSPVAAAVVKDGAKVPKPTDPTRTGYTFKGWLNGDTEYNFDTAVKADITLKAKWEVITYTVTFESDGDSEVAAAKVNHGEKVPKPADPTKDGYTFKGWFDGDDKEYKFDTAVTANITLKAKWEVVTYTVTFDSNGGSDVAAAKVNHGEKVPKPEDPTKDGFTFKGWFNGATEYAFETAVTANITLKAKWEVEAKEELSADGNVLTITNPKIENEWGTTVEKNCVITFSGNSAVKFVHKDLLSFDKIEFQYTVEKADANEAKISVKAADLKLEENKYKDCAYPTLNKEGGSLVYSMSELKSQQAGMEYIVLANNSNDGDWKNGPAWDADWKLTITKIVLSKTVAGTAIKEFGKGETVKFADLEITSENAANYLLRVSFTLDDPEKKGWGAGAIADSGWTDLGISNLPVNEEGFIDIEISDIIVKSDSFLINWWASYATLLKCEIIKK